MNFLWRVDMTKVFKGLIRVLIVCTTCGAADSSLYGLQQVWKAFLENIKYFGYLDNAKEKIVGRPIKLRII